MLKFLLIIVFLLIPRVYANDIIAFRGVNEAFDHSSFLNFAKKKNLNPIVFSSLEINKALAYINTSKKDYELYGYSLGAATVGKILAYQFNSNKKMPTYVITIGAYKTTDINFTKYNVSYDNYVDRSGLGNVGPGRFIDVPHDKLQKKVNEIYFNE